MCKLGLTVTLEGGFICLVSKSKGVKKSNWCQGAWNCINGEGLKLVLQLVSVSYMGTKCDVYVAERIQPQLTYGLGDLLDGSFLGTKGAKGIGGGGEKSEGSDK